MLSGRYASISLLFGLILLVFCPTVPAAGVRSAYGYGAHNDAQNPNRGVFPFVTWIRDTAIELIFGRPASSTAKSAPALGMGALNPRYSKETVIRFNVSRHEEERALADAADRLFLDVWATTRNHVDIRLHKNDVAPLLTLLPKSLHSAFSTLIPDLPSAVMTTFGSDRSGRSAVPDTDARFDSEKPLALSVIQPAQEFDNVFFHNYQPLHVIHHWMRLVASMFPDIVTLETIGKSFEGRKILALRIGKPVAANGDGKDGGEGLQRKTLVINGGLHAREWIGTATVNYLAWSLISSYQQEPVMTRFLENYSTVLIPVLNPDGYQYTWDVDRLWRKSRQDTPVNFCRGLDIDHAFGFEWSKDLPEPCSENYGGQQPFQAVEAQQLSKWAKKQVTKGGANFVGFIDVHSYSQEILYPYSYTCKSEPPNMENLQELAAGIAKAVRLSSGEQYDVLSACEGVLRSRDGRHIESGGGSAIDWFYHVMHAKYSYQIRLRDRGSYGFLLPREEIIPTGEEMFNALKYYADFLLGNNGIEKSIDRLSESVGPGAYDDAPEPGELSELKRRRRRR